MRISSPFISQDSAGMSPFFAPRILHPISTIAAFNAAQPFPVERVASAKGRANIWLARWRSASHWLSTWRPDCALVTGFRRCGCPPR